MVYYTMVVYNPTGGTRTAARRGDRLYRRFAGEFVPVVGGPEIRVRTHRDDPFRAHVRVGRVVVFIDVVYVRRLAEPGRRVQVPQVRPEVIVLADQFVVAHEVGVIDHSYYFVRSVVLLGRPVLMWVYDRPTGEVSRSATGDETGG